MPDEPVPDDVAGLRAANARLRELLAERDAEVAGLRAGLGSADRELIRRLRASACRAGAPPGHGQHRLGDSLLEGADRGERGPAGPAAVRAGPPARTASPAGSPVTRAKGRYGTRSRASRTPRRRLLSAGPPGRAWAAPRPETRGGRRSSTSRSSGKRPSGCCPALRARAAGRSRSRRRRLACSGRRCPTGRS